MTDKICHIMTTALIIFVVLAGAPFILPSSQAEARPGSLLRESRQKRTRTHRADRRRSESSREKNSSRPSSSSSRRPRRPRRDSATPARPTGPPRTTGRTRQASPGRSSTRHRHRSSRPPAHYRPGRHTVHHRPPTRVYRTTRRRHRPRTSSHVHIINHHDVHHHYDHYETQPHQTQTHTQIVEKKEDSPSSLDFYITAGTGMSALDAPQISFDALPGGDFNLGLGAVGELIGLEIGFHSALFRFDPYSSWLDVILMGASTDLKLQPSLSILEPFVSAGLGAYHLRDTFLNEGAAGASLRLATGIDLRFSQLALSFRYQRNFYYLLNDHSYYGGLDAQTESFGLNLSFYL